MDVDAHHFKSSFAVAHASPTRTAEKIEHTRLSRPWFLGKVDLPI
jgi:hypothetical protein